MHFLLYTLSGGKFQDCICALANVVGIMIGVGPENSNLWYHLFDPEKLEETFVPGFLVCFFCFFFIFLLKY